MLRPLATLLLLATPVAAAELQDLQQLLEDKSCQGCALNDADLVHAELSGAQLQQAQLQGANLSRAKLRGADLRDADLRQAVLLGADLSRADLRGAQLSGSDLRQSDLTGAKLDPGALSSSHWQGAQGVPAGANSYADLHNSGVEAALQGRHPEAEQRFSAAIGRRPEAAISWLARGIARGEQGRELEAAADLQQAGRLYRQGGNDDLADQLDKAAKQLRDNPKKPSGNGWGSAILGGAAGLFKQLAPYALKLMGPGLL